MQVTKEKASAIEKATRKQSKCNRWFLERAWHIPSSSFGDVCHATWWRDMDKLAENITCPPHLTTAAILHGRNFEKDARNKFVEVTKLEVTKCGLFVSPEHPFLCATPDGLVGDDHVLEIKCPYTGRHEMITPSKNFPFLEENKPGSISLKKTSKYYDQVQGQMALTGRHAVYFVVYTFVDFKYCIVQFDQEYWLLSMLPKLTTFFDKHLKPCVAKHM